MLFCFFNYLFFGLPAASSRIPIFFFGFRQPVTYPLFLGFRQLETGGQLLISGTVAAGVIATAPEGQSLLSTFLDHALEHRFATFGTDRSIGR